MGSLMERVIEPSTYKVLWIGSMVLDSVCGGYSVKAEVLKSNRVCSSSFACPKEDEPEEKDTREDGSDFVRSVLFPVVGGDSKNRLLRYLEVFCGLGTELHFRKGIPELVIIMHKMNHCDSNSLNSEIFCWHQMQLQSAEMSS
jgi:hypothetical protein